MTATEVRLMPGPPTLAWLLRHLRDQHQWTQAELGARLGVSRSAISMAETGKSGLTAEPLIRLLAEEGHLR